MPTSVLVFPCTTKEEEWCSLAQENQHVKDATKVAALTALPQQVDKKESGVIWSQRLTTDSQMAISKSLFKAGNTLV